MAHNMFRIEETKTFPCMGVVQLQKSLIMATKVKRFGDPKA